jgi:hypothetical protein
MASDLLENRLMALDAGLRAAGIPVHGVAFVNAEASPPSVRVDYTAAATPAQQTQGAVIVSSFVWTQAAQAAYLVTVQRQQATALLGSPEGTLKLLRAAFDVARDEINALRARTPTPILSITRVNAVATATCFAPHGFSNGTVFITGADVAAYNGAKAITVTSPTAFTFAVTGTPVTPATGSISAFLSTASVAAPRTFPQFVTAIQARIADGSVD